MVYGYCRISTKKQSIDRQIRNIKAQYEDAVIVQEAYTGTKMERKEWSKLVKKLKSGDTVVFDSVSRMSRNADEGIKVYFELFDKGISLVFLKEPTINTSVYVDDTQDKLAMTGTDVDEILKGINNYFRKVAVKQIRIAFEQAQKEVDDLHKRTKEGIVTARLNGKQIGRIAGQKYQTQKEKKALELIKIHSKSFDGTLKDDDVMKLCGISRKTYYKYKKILSK